MHRTLPKPGAQICPQTLWCVSRAEVSPQGLHVPTAPHLPVLPTTACPPHPTTSVTFTPAAACEVTLLLSVTSCHPGEESWGDQAVGDPSCPRLRFSCRTRRSSSALVLNSPLQTPLSASQKWHQLCCSFGPSTADVQGHL